MKVKKFLRSGAAAVLAVIMLPIGLNIGVMAVNDIGAAAARSKLAKEIREKNLTVTAARCKVGRFGGNGNGAEYLAVVFLSDIPDEGAFEGCWLYLPEEYEKKFGYAIAPPGDYKCAAVKLTSPENFLLYDFDLRGH